MKVSKTKCDVHVEKLHCSCGLEMSYNGKAFYTSPLQYQHQCKCGEEKHTSTTQYPKYVFEEVSDEN